MRFPRIRWTVRRLMLLVLAVAVVLVLVEEFGAGLPPRSILRSLPGRVARLRVGMKPAEVNQILGLGRPWWQGGIGIQEGYGRGSGGSICFTYHIEATPPTGLRDGWAKHLPSHPPQTLRLCFLDEDGWKDWDTARDSRTLSWADLEVNGRAVVEMPRRINR